MKQSPKSTLTRVFWGLFFIFAAVFIALQVFGVLSVDLNIGTIILLILVTAVVIGSLAKLFWVGVFLPLAFAVMLLSQSGILSEMTGEQIGMTYAIAALVAVGFHILFHTRASLHISSHKDGLDASFSSATKYFNEEPLDHASIDCSFGTVKAYFNDTKLKGKTAIISIDNSFGSVELYIPKSWRIEQKIENSFGATTEKNHPKTTDSSPVITLTGDNSFGSVSITYV